VIVLHVTVHVKPEYVTGFLDAARYNAAHSTADEPGCVRFDIIQDRDDPNCFRFYEVYHDDAALAVHRQTTHFTRYIEGSARWLAVPAERHLGLLVNE
jgi:(4S)-4-hydroxy-5-phosphonooxypentane-2,3-dione isomerase